MGMCDRCGQRPCDDQTESEVALCAQCREGCAEPERIAGTFVGMVWRRGDEISRCKITYRDDPKSPGVDVQVTGIGRANLMADAVKALDAAIEMRAESKREADTIFGKVA